VLAATLLSSPLFGMPEADGEVLAAPFVMLGLVCAIAAVRRQWGRRTALLAATAGVAAMCAALIKQNVVDVFVFVAVLLVLARPRTARPWARGGVFAGGALATLVVALAGAALRGTTPGGLWDAVVVFRLQASAVIGSSASAETSARMSRMISAFLVSGGAAVLLIATALALLTVLSDRRRVGAPRGDHALVWAALAIAAWELFGAAAGGSYWLHYLTGLLPGLVLLVCLARPGRRTGLVLAAALAYVLASTGTIWAQHATAPVAVSTDAQVVTYLREHATPADGVVVAFGHPGIVADSGLTSPYQYLWSLPVRVRDPRLADLQRVLSGPSAPAWVVVAGTRLGSWGLDDRSAQAYLEAHYTDQATYGDWHVWHRAEGPR
jgi:hypothetical protein